MRDGGKINKNSRVNLNFSAVLVFFSFFKATVSACSHNNVRGRSCFLETSLIMFVQRRFNNLFFFLNVELYATPRKCRLLHYKEQR